MTYKMNIEEISKDENIYCTVEDHYIPLYPNNRHYQECLDAIIKDGADAFDGDIPTDLQAAADAKKFAQQLADYKIATARLEQYEVEKGRDEVKETRNTGRKVWDEDKEEWVDETEEFISQTKIDPVEATVEVTTTDMNTEPYTVTTSTIENPLITTDKAERASAQAVVDATPQAVKDAT